MASIDRYPGGRWRARWRDPDGKSRSEVFDRKVDAQRRITSVEGSKLKGEYIDPKAGRITVKAFYEVWSARQPWRDSSRLSIESLFENHVLPKLGGRPLNTLRRGDIESWASKLPLARPGQAVQYLSTMLEAAVADRHLAMNPARGAKRPRVDRDPVTPLTDAEIDALRKAAPPWFGVALTLGVGVGLRQSEATGLTVDRVDFLRRQLTVDRQLVTPKAGDCTFGPPKSSKSYRTVPMPDAVVTAMSQHVEAHGTGRDGLVLHLTDGRPLRRQHFGKVWRQIRTTAKLPTARFHDLRHTYASVLLSGGVSVAATAEYLGHTPAVLLSTYAHLLPADHDRARVAVQEAFTRDSATHKTKRAGVFGVATASENPLVCHDGVTDDVG